MDQLPNADYDIRFINPHFFHLNYMKLTLIKLQRPHYIARALEEACKLLEVGFEYVCEMDGKKLFRKCKCARVKMSILHGKHHENVDSIRVK